MPVEIKELVIRAEVRDPSEDRQATASNGSTMDAETIVEDCVRRVLTILKKSKER
jgi:hypothetical protein